MRQGPGRGYPLWTQEEDERLRKLVEAGVGRSRAAHKLDRPQRGVEMRARKLGLRFRDVRAVFSKLRPDYIGWSAARLKQALEMWKDSQSAAAIAKLLGGGMTKNAVAGKMFRLGIPSPKNNAAELSRRQREKSRRGALKKPPPLRLLPPKSAKVFVDRFTRREDRPAAWLPSVPAADVARIAHDDLKSRHCRWPIGDMREAVAKGEPCYCGAPREPGLPYCQAHNERAYSEVSAAPRQHFSGEKGGAVSAKPTGN